MRKAIFLDRDGVINNMVYHAEFGIVDSPANPDEFEMKPGVAEAVQQINRMGFLAVVVSNQPGVAKGKMTKTLLKATMEKMKDLLRKDDAYLDGVYFCMHHPNAKLKEYRIICDCRKPKPGLLFQAAADLDINLEGSYFVGDGITDVIAGKEAGCRTILVNSRKCYLCDELSRLEVEPDYMAENLKDAIQAVTFIESGDSSSVENYEFNCRVTTDC